MRVGFSWFCGESAEVGVRDVFVFEQEGGGAGGGGAAGGIERVLGRGGGVDFRDGSAGHSFAGPVAFSGDGAGDGAVEKRFTAEQQRGPVEHRAGHLATGSLSVLAGEGAEIFGKQHLAQAVSRFHAALKAEGAVEALARLLLALLRVLEEFVHFLEKVLRLGVAFGGFSEQHAGGGFAGEARHALDGVRELGGGRGGFGKFLRALLPVVAELLFEFVELAGKFALLRAKLAKGETVFRVEFRLSPRRLWIARRVPSAPR